MARRITHKDGADAVAMLDAEAKTSAKSAPKRTPKAKVTKADKIRAEWMKDPNARPADVAKATGTDPAYVWDVRAAMQKKGTIPMPAKVDKAGAK